MKMSFRNVSLATSAICFGLALLWIFFPQFLLWIWRVEPGESAFLMARRSGALFLGLGVLLFGARDAEPSPVRSAIALGLAAACSVIAALGVFEFAAKRAGLGIWLAIVVEIALAVAFVRVRQADPVAGGSKVE